jgi:hypothetical protein
MQPNNKPQGPKVYVDILQNASVCFFLRIPENNSFGIFEIFEIFTEAKLPHVSPNKEKKQEKTWIPQLPSP